MASRIYAVHLENRLRDIETDCRNRLHDLAPPNRGGLNSTHIHGTLVPVEEPSTASKADSCGAAKYLLSHPRRELFQDVESGRSLDAAPASNYSQLKACRLSLEPVWRAPEIRHRLRTSP